MADLTSKERDALPAEHFAVPGKRKLPISDEHHTRLAWDMVDRTQGLTPSEKATARSRILHRAKELGIDTKDWTGVKASFDVQAMALNMPAWDQHPNRMPFSGILTRIGTPSDAAPHGTEGKRIILTEAAVKEAIPSLLGMAVDLTTDMKGHDAQNKIGVITGAHIDGDALVCEGFIYAADFPREALRIHLDQADLGFSFEALNLAVESLETDPLVVKSLVFTGAAILMKDSAAYTTTRLAAAAAKEHEMTDEMLKAMREAITASLAPVSEAVAKLQAGHDATTASLAALTNKVNETPTIIQAHAATMKAVEPHAQAIDGVANGLEAAGIGLDPNQGHVAFLRKMAGQMRAAAATGHVPAAFSGGYYASAAPVIEPPKVDLDKDPAVIAMRKEIADMKAAAETKAKADADALAASETKIKDLQAAAAAARPGPERKTIPPMITGVLAKGGIEVPAGDNPTLSMAKVNAALDAAGKRGTDRIAFKLGLQKAGFQIDENGAA